MTPAESARLRRVSYDRQLARGFKRPGYSGLVAERFGDAEPYVPPSEHTYTEVKHTDEEEADPRRFPSQAPK